MYDIIKVYVSIQPRLITLKNFIQDFFIMIKAVDSNRDLSLSPITIQVTGEDTIDEVKAKIISICCKQI